MRATKLEYKKENSIDGIKNILKPKYIYIPKYENMQYSIKKGSYVYKGQVVGIDDDLFKMHSSISGEVVAEVLYNDSFGNSVNAFMVENDFKELYEQKLISTKNISEYSKEEFISIIKNAGIVGLGGAGFPAYKKYIQDDLKCLVVNAVECEPFIESDKVLIKEKVEELLEVIDAIVEINKLDKAIIAVKCSNLTVIDVINQYQGSYLNIDLILVNDQYPNGWEKKVIFDTMGITYDRYPSEVGIVVNNVSTIYAIYEALKYNKPLIERIITITGNNVLNPTNCLVKIGTSLNEIISEIGGLHDNKGYLITGGVMTGEPLMNLDVLVNKQNNAFLSLKEFTHIETACMKCGKCANNCPSMICPILVKENINNVELLKDLNVDKCIDCGLCSYICPAKIEIREYVRKARKMVK